MRTAWSWAIQSSTASSHWACSRRLSSLSPGVVIRASRVIGSTCCGEVPTASAPSLRLLLAHPGPFMQAVQGGDLGLVSLAIGNLS